MKSLNAVVHPGRDAESRRFKLGWPEFGVLLAVIGLMLFLTSFVLWPFWR